MIKSRNMANHFCSSCKTFGGRLETRDEELGSYEVTLATIHKAALISCCRVCGFVKDVLAKDTTTPKVGEALYRDARVKVNEGGLIFTGQWQGALVTEIYSVSKFEIQAIKQGM